MSDSELDFFPTSLSAQRRTQNSGRSQERRVTRNFWTSARDTRLLDWFEENNLRARVVFMSGTDIRNWSPLDEEGNLITKASCYKHAVQVVFAVDGNVKVRKMLENNHGFQTLENRVRNQVISWKKKYEEVNNEIKRNRPSQKLEDIRIGTQIYQDLLEYHKCFHFWGRLHAYWYSAPTSTSIASQRNNRNRVFVHESGSSSATVAEPVASDKENRAPELENGSRTRRQPQNGLENPRLGIAIGRVERPVSSQQYENQMGITPEQRIRLQILENEASRIRGVQEVVLQFVKCSAETRDKNLGTW